MESTHRHVPELRQQEPRPGGPRWHSALRRLPHDLPWIVDAQATDFDAAIDAAMPVLVDLWAEWCGPCRVVSPVVEALGRSRAGRLKVVKVDIEAAPAVAQRYGAMSIPTLLLMRDGQEVDRVVGALPEPALRDWLDQALATSDASHPAQSGATSP